MARKKKSGFIVIVPLALAGVLTFAWMLAKGVKA
jgi:hypothetical protein